MNVIVTFKMESFENQQKEHMIETALHSSENTLIDLGFMSIPDLRRLLESREILLWPPKVVDLSNKVQGLKQPKEQHENEQVTEELQEQVSVFQPILVTLIFSENNNKPSLSVRTCLDDLMTAIPDQILLCQLVTMSKQLTQDDLKSFVISYLTILCLPSDYQKGFNMQDNVETFRCITQTMDEANLKNQIDECIQKLM